MSNPEQTPPATDRAATEDVDGPAPNAGANGAGAAVGEPGVDGAADPVARDDAPGSPDAGDIGDEATLVEPLDASEYLGDAAGAGVDIDGVATRTGDEGASAAFDADSLEARLGAAEARADENWDRLLRLQAEMENQRKRAQRDVTNARKFALEGIVNDLLPVRDSLEMGMIAAAEEGATVESIREGSELTLKMLSGALEKHNIVAIDPLGERFDPEYHQAMSMQVIEGAAPNTVVTVMQKGYTLNDRLIRPALVMVAK